MPSPQHVVVHYHRIENDYQSWHLAIFPLKTTNSTPSAHSVFKQARQYSITSFGAVYRIDLSIFSDFQQLLLLPFCNNLKNPDTPTRRLDLEPAITSGHPITHVFIAQASPDVHSSVRHIKTPLNTPRFLYFSFSASSSTRAPFLHLYSSDTSSSPPFHHVTVFPATPLYRPADHPLLFMLDLLPLTNPQFLHPVLIFNHAQSHPRASSPVHISSPLALPTSSQHHRLQFEAGTHPVTSLVAVESSHEFSDVTELISMQPLVNPALSANSACAPVLPAEMRSLMLAVPTSTTSAVNAGLSRSDDILTVYCESVDGKALSSPSITVTPCDPGAASLSVQTLSRKYRTASVHVVDLSSLSASERAAGLLLTSKHSARVKWMPAFGDHVVLAPSYPRLLTAGEVDGRVLYHRYGEFDDWRLWRLRLSSKASSEYATRTIVLPALRPVSDGVVLFDLTATLFPYGVDVEAVTFRIMGKKEPLVGDSGPLSMDDKESDEQIDLLDIQRSWKSGHVFGDIHFIQGDGQLHSSPPCRRDMVSKRKFRFRYRRFLPGDYEGWDLWTWDATDPVGCGTAVVPDLDDIGSAWIDFVFDRAHYGAAVQIHAIPRRGGIKWVERDEPVRIWHVELLNTSTEKNGDEIPTFIITQGTNLVTRSLEVVRDMLEVYVDSESSIMVRTPVPIEWMSPPRSDRPVPAKDTLVKLCEEATVERVAKANTVNLDVSGKILRFRKVLYPSPVETRLIFEKREVFFNEDFLVERVVVLVPGFRTLVLSWRRHQDWDKYLYDGLLGWDYRKDKCIFRCFAPTADAVFVVLYDCATGLDGRSVIPMRRIPEGCWKVTVSQDLRGKYYKLLTEGEDKRLFPGVEVIDPYSRCNTAHNGRGFIFGSEKTVVIPRLKMRPSDTIVYELHIRDITIDEESGISKRGKFCGLAERGTRIAGERSVSTKEPLTNWEQERLPGADEHLQHLDQYSTGLDHIAQMGVNTVQLLPVQDFDNDESDDTSYRWGYMPVHYNSPDGWYASSTSAEARVTEFKQLVDAIHKAGMKVIMDVVYNHTAEDTNEYNLDARFSFNGLVPRYYYRTCGNTPVAHTGDSTCGRRPAHEPRCGECYSNGSGCGNEFRSEAPMGRKFIIDSLKYWVNEYQVDGFRFDLLGLIDVDTISQAAAELHAIDENIMLYGEPWCGGLTPIRTTEKGMQRSKGFGVFNNSFRDAIRGSPFDSEETFVMDGGRLSEVKGGIIGSIDSFCDAPIETINYVECHDNYTLWDHFRFYVRERSGDIQFTEEDLRRMHRLAAVIIFTSQGVPFIQAGQEMCRTKFDVENSYESPDEINMIQWQNKLKEWSMVCYYRGLILLRRAHPEIFCKHSAAEIHSSLIFYEDLGLPVPDRCIAYRVQGDAQVLYDALKKQQSQNAPNAELKEESLRWTEIVVLLNPTPSLVVFRLPGGKEDCIWLQVLDATYAGVRDIRGPAIGSVEVQGRSAAVLRRASLKDTEDAQLALRLDAVSDSYCCFHGDDGLTRYAVGLDKEPNEKDATERRQLLDARLQFQERRELNTNRPTTSELGTLEAHKK